MAELLLGLLVGYFARDMRDKIMAIYGALRNRIERQPGVVRPDHQRFNEPIDLSETGPVRSPSPRKYAILNQLEDNKRKL